jgi:lipopolysaccharide/colanic/teichoic acid biosynthesis glycosyltransferase
LASISIVREGIREEGLGWKAVGVCERTAAALLLAAASPLLAGAAIATAALSGRAPFILHRRVGHLGAPLWMLKLRTMWNDGGDRRGGWVERIEDEHGPAGKRPGDARVTSCLAAFLRRHSIDELPQLWHVVTGEMALIGPRPLTQREIREHYAGVAAELLSVRPGIAGLWQTSGRNRLTYAERRRLDLEFVRRRSLAMYVRIVARSVVEIWSGANTW